MRVGPENLESNPILVVFKTMIIIIITEHGFPLILRITLQSSCTRQVREAATQQLTRTHLPPHTVTLFIVTGEHVGKTLCVLFSGLYLQYVWAARLLLLPLGLSWQPRACCRPRRPLLQAGVLDVLLVPLLAAVGLAEGAVAAAAGMGRRDAVR